MFWTTVLGTQFYLMRVGPDSEASNVLNNNVIHIVVKQLLP